MVREGCASRGVLSSGSVFQFEGVQEILLCSKGQAVGRDRTDAATPAKPMDGNSLTTESSIQLVKNAELFDYLLRSLQ